MKFFLWIWTKFFVKKNLPAPASTRIGTSPLDETLISSYRTGVENRKALQRATELAEREKEERLRKEKEEIEQRINHEHFAKAFSFAAEWAGKQGFSDSAEAEIAIYPHNINLSKSNEWIIFVSKFETLCSSIDIPIRKPLGNLHLTGDFPIYINGRALVRYIKLAEQREAAAPNKTITQGAYR